MPQKTRVVGLDVAKSKVDACIRSTGRRLTASSTPEGLAALAAWARANRVGRAVMEASGGYERSSAEALRAIGVEVLVVDPKRVRCFAKAAGRLAKNDPIDAETIAWFAETFRDSEAQPHDPVREEVDRLVQVRTALKDLEGRIDQQSEHRRRPSSPGPSARSPRRCGRSCASSTPPSPPRSKPTGFWRDGPKSSTACRGSPLKRSPA
jgi:transposase